MSEKDNENSEKNKETFAERGTVPVRERIVANGAGNKDQSRSESLGGTARDLSNEEGQNQQGEFRRFGGPRPRHVRMPRRGGGMRRLRTGSGNRGGRSQSSQGGSGGESRVFDDRAGNVGNEGRPFRAGDGGSGRRSYPSVTELLGGGLRERALAADAKLRSQLMGSILLRFSDSGKSYFFNWSIDNLSAGFTDSPASADCVITLSDQTLVRIASGELNPQIAMLSDKIKIEGKLSLAIYWFNLLAFKGGSEHGYERED